MHKVIEEAVSLLVNAGAKDSIFCAVVTSISDEDDNATSARTSFNGEPAHLFQIVDTLTSVIEDAAKRDGVTEALEAVAEIRAAIAPFCIRQEVH